MPIRSRNLLTSFASRGTQRPPILRMVKPPASTITIATDRITFIKALYPRLREDDAIIERYRAAIDRLPPIVIARGHVLVDGFHPWQAYRREGRKSIPAIDLGNITDAEIFNESIRRNAEHGLQLSLRDKERLATKLWQTYADLLNGDRTAEIAKLLAVSTKSIERWTKDIRAREKEAQKDRAWDMWLDGASEKRIADELQVHQTTVAEWIKEKRQQSEFLNPPESRQHFDVWQFAMPDNDGGTPSLFGKLAPQVIENLLWLYTDPGIAYPESGSAARWSA
jgi:transposase